ncbi:MAG: glycerol-3-phosphate dehydrogenase [Planktomarina sp.]
MADTDFDIFVVGGGVNGTGIARDATGRGLKVALAEMKDLGWATSSSSTKLFHGGLRYLEYFEVRLVRESLIERERLLTAMPHISWPMRFVLPHHRDMRFDNSTPTSKLLSFVMPWMKGRRPAWLIRLGLFMYDNLGGRKLLPPTSTVNLRTAEEGIPLDDKFTKAFEYSDCWVEDSRLVVLNARDAEARGAQIMTRAKVTAAERTDDHWTVTVDQGGEVKTFTSKTIVNAAGPWVEDVLRGKMRQNSTESVRLVRGSHIITKRLFDHDKCYFFQGTDGRIIFAIPYETDFTLIGTTDAEHDVPDHEPICTPEEQTYLINFINQYLKKDIVEDDVVWTYSGVRPLYDDDASSAAAATRDYVLSMNTEGAPMLSVFGGKITTYRKLAEHALRDLEPHLPMGEAWTAGTAMPGGDFNVDEVEGKITQLRSDYPFLTPRWAQRLIRGYGTDAWAILGDAKTADDLGADYGATLTGAEVTWLKDFEYAQTADDILWRRSKLGLRLTKDQAAKLAADMTTAA